MVTIKEAEMQTGITRQNIRYYEKIGLLQPSREQENKYRNYSEEDIRRLKLILLFRKLDMPLEEIRQLLEGTIELQDALQMQKEMLEERQQKLQAAISFCGQIEEKELTQLDVDGYLSKIKTEEKTDIILQIFFRIIKKYCKVKVFVSSVFSGGFLYNTPTDDGTALLVCGTASFESGNYKRRHVSGIYH